MLDLPVGIPDEGDFSFGRVPITRTDELHSRKSPNDADKCEGGGLKQLTM
jgi:hypothetical protein